MIQMSAMIISKRIATAWCLGKHALGSMKTNYKPGIQCADAGTLGFCFQMDAGAQYAALWVVHRAVMTYANCAHLQQERNPPDHMWS